MFRFLASLPMALIIAALFATVLLESSDQLYTWACKLGFPSPKCVQFIK